MEERRGSKKGRCVVERKERKKNELKRQRMGWTL